MNGILISVAVLGAIGFIFAILLGFLSKKLKVQEDERVEKILNVVSGANCGACGFGGCRAFVSAVVKENKLFSGCIPGGKEVNEKIAKILGIDDSLVHSKVVAIYRCAAEEGEKKISSLYHGPQTCPAAELVKGVIDCLYGCLGFGDCIKRCPKNAISFKNKKIHVDIKKCIGCGKCVKGCPRQLFQLVPVKENWGSYYVACNNKEKALDVKKVCSRGCLGCGICVKLKNSPFYLKDNLSYLDYSKISAEYPLKEAQAKCPVKCILKSE